MAGLRNLLLNEGQEITNYLRADKIQEKGKKYINKPRRKKSINSIIFDNPIKYDTIYLSKNGKI